MFVRKRTSPASRELTKHFGRTSRSEIDSEIIYRAHVNAVRRETVPGQQEVPRDNMQLNNMSDTLPGVDSSTRNHSFMVR